MSIACCERCSSMMIDTDYNTEWYREDIGNACLCDECYQVELDARPSVQDLIAIERDNQEGDN